MTLAELDFRGAFMRRPTLEQARRRNALSVRELAERAGVHPATISRIEHGATPRMPTLRKLARELEMEPTAIDWPGDPLGVGARSGNGSRK